MKYAKKVYLLILLFLILACSQQKTIPNKIPHSGAGLALDAWVLSRSYPHDRISVKHFSEAHDHQKSMLQSRSITEEWEAIGPKNIAGRALKIAFHPTDSSIVYLGSASGGLWKSNSAGLGVDAWERIDIGFPVLAVSSIALSTQNPETIYIGTGEMYNIANTMPSVVNRLTRGTYGFGIFKSTDGGETWQQSLNWTYQDMRAIQEIEINPLNDEVIYAASSIGLLKSTNAGSDWENIQEIPMAVDVDISPRDTNQIFVSYGSLFNEESGIYRSKDAGISFDKLRIGIPTSYTGKAMLCIDPVNEATVYATIANAFESIGLYRSTNGGDSWVQVNDEDIAAFQGWYSHDVAVNPNKPNELIQVGIDTWKSESSGFFPMQQTSWLNGRSGQNPVGEPDGPPDYVHSDIHQVIFHPLIPNTVFLATDGGVFVSKDGGNSYESRNGGLQTTQFYANFTNASVNPNFALGGMQDNSTAIYTGEDAWTLVLSGDGMSTAIDPVNNNYVYGSSQFLNIFRSTDAGETFEDIAPGAINPIFSAPFEIAPSNPSILYAGGRLLFKSENRGTDWTTPNADFVDDGNGILTIAVAPNNSNRLYISTVPTATDVGKVFSSNDGGATWRTMVGLPNRIATDIVFHPEKEEIAFITFGGFNTFHVYQTLNNGDNWFPIDNNLPDVPHNTIVINPDNPSQIYLGNDLGVYVSEDEGGNWSLFNEGLPETVLAMHLSISPSNQKLRLATHGNGVYQVDLIGKELTSSNSQPYIPSFQLFQNYPNPVLINTTIGYELQENSSISLKIFDLQGKLIQTPISNQYSQKGVQEIVINMGDFDTGAYVYQLLGETTKGQFFKASKILVKK